MRRRRAAIALVAVAAAAAPSASAPLAQGAGFTMAIPAPGFCTPAPEDPDYVARTIKALGLPAVATKPIAVLDTGVDPGSPELAGHVLQGYDARTGAPVGDDPSGHGTQLAGVAASAGPGMRGVSPASPILPIRVAAPDRAVTADALAKGIALAVQHGAGVILVGGTGALADPPDTGTLQVIKAVGDAVGKGVLVIAAAGDEDDAKPTMPGALPHVLTAASATPDTKRTSTSSFGPWLDLLTPGEGVSGPLPIATCIYGYGYSTGSTVAAAVLAGAAAIVQASRPDLAPQQLFDVLRRAAVDLGEAGRDNDTGFGLLDVSRALSAEPLPKEGLAEVDDDPYWVRGAYAKAHPPLLSKKRKRFSATASVSSAKDPADVVPVALTKGDRVVVDVTAADPGALLELSVLSASAGDFDVSNGATGNVLRATGGVSNAPHLEFRAKRSGLHFFAVSASDPVDPDDDSYVPTDQDPYQITATRKAAKAKKPPAKKARRKAPAHKKRAAAKRR